MALPNRVNNTDDEILAAYDELAAAEAGECILNAEQERWMHAVADTFSDQMQ